MVGNIPLLAPIIKPVDGVLINQASIVAECVDFAELVERLLEGGGLVFVASHIAVDVVEAGTEVVGDGLSKVILDVESCYAPSSTNEVSCDSFADTGL